jgi:hypothetical protein
VDQVTYEARGLLVVAWDSRLLYFAAVQQSRDLFRVKERSRLLGLDLHLG